MSEKNISVNFPAGHLLSDAKAFLQAHGCAFQGCVEYGVTYLKVTFPAGTTATPIEPRTLEYRQRLTLPDGTTVTEIQLRSRGSGPQYSQILRRKENQQQ